MSTKTPKAWQTKWAQEAIRDEASKPRQGFQFGPDEQARIDAVKIAAASPAGVSREVLAAPARGPVAPFRESVVLPAGDDGFEVVDAPYRSGCPGRARDVFDVMVDQALRSGGAAPFTAGQVGAARDYRAVYERVQSSGMKLSSVGVDRTGGQGRVDFMDAYMRDSERLSGFRAAIGDGVALSPKHRSASVVRRAIMVRELVDAVCIRERALSAVLTAHGWKVSGKARNDLRAALCAALGRMRGYWGRGL